MIFASFLFLPARKKYSVYNETCSEFLNFFKEEKKMMKKEKLKKLCKEHQVELVVGTGAVIIGGVGAYFGYKFGIDVGYSLGHRVAESQIAKTIPGAVEGLGKHGCFAAMDMIKEEVPEAYKMIMEYCKTGTGARMDARTRFYNNPSVMKYLADWKKYELK